MIPHHTKSPKIHGTGYQEIHKYAFISFKRIKARTKRRPYVKSAYFGNQKIFFDYFWKHLMQKSWKMRAQRLKYFDCAVELIRKSRQHPVSKENPNKPTEILHRFAGITKDKDLFIVQIKEDKKTDKKYFMSAFPIKDLLK